MAAKRVDLLIDQGATFKVIVAIKDSAGDTRSLIGYTATMQARENVSSVSTLFSINPDVDGPNGLVTINIPFANTTSYIWKRGVYDLEITNGTEVERILEGNIFVSPEVTR